MIGFGGSPGRNGFAVAPAITLLLVGVNKLAKNGLRSIASVEARLLPPAPTKELLRLLCVLLTSIELRRLLGMCKDKGTSTPSSFSVMRSANTSSLGCGGTTTIGGAAAAGC